MFLFLYFVLILKSLIPPQILLFHPPTIIPSSDSLFFNQLGGVSDGQWDNTPTLTKFLASTDAKGKVLIFSYSDSEYLFSSTVIFRNLKNIKIIGTGVSRPKIKFKSENTIGFRIENCTDLQIENLHFIGSGEKKLGVNAAAIKIVNSRKITVNNCIVQNGITNGIEGFLSDSCIISNNVVFDTKNYNGIGWAGGNFNLFKSNLCFGNRGQGIELRSVHFATVDGNICTNNGELGEQSSGITIECEDGSFPVKKFGHDDDRIFYTNTYSGFSNNDTVKIKFGSLKPSEYVALSVRTASDSNSTFYLIKDLHNKTNEMKKIPFKGATEELLDVGTSNVNLINNIVANNIGFGIYVVSSRNDNLTGILIQNNTIFQNELSGIFVTTFSNNRNLIKTKNISILNNSLINNGFKKNKWPIWLDHVDSVTVKYNFMSGNGRADQLGLNGVFNSIIE